MIFGLHDANTLEQFHDVSSRAERSALMADGHLGYVMPIGGVAAYDGRVSVVGVGFDIACGNAAIRTDVRLSDFGKSPEKLAFMMGRFADEIQSTISFGVGRSNKADDAPTDHPLFDSTDWYRIKERAGHGEMRRLNDKAREQLGTVGSGNHYVDIFVDESGWLWVGVHFGSRGFGHGIATGFLNISTGADWFAKAKETEVLLDLRSSMGDDYWALMSLAGQYAYAGREWVARKVVQILGGKEVELVHNHHNFAWKETHSGQEYVVVRKGATPAFPGQKGFVGGSMGDNSVILQGALPQDSPDNMFFNRQTFLQEESLYSTVHGAGRVMGRAEAKKGKVLRDEKGTPIGRDTSTIITREAQREWLSGMNVIVRGGDVDEAPQAYRRLPDVLTSQGPTITILHELKPVIVVMAGNDIKDPYQD